jgi:hypothetical protein
MTSARRFAIVPMLVATGLSYAAIGCHGDHDDEGRNASYSDRGNYNHDYDHGRYDDRTNYDRHQYDRDFH